MRISGIVETEQEKVGWMVEACYPCRERLDPNLFRFQSKVWLDMQCRCMPNKPEV